MHAMWKEYQNYGLCKGALKVFTLNNKINKKYQFFSKNLSCPQFSMISHTFFQNLVLIGEKLRVRYRFCLSKCMQYLRPTGSQWTRLFETLIGNTWTYLNDVLGYNVNRSYIWKLMVIHTCKLNSVMLFNKSMILKTKQK